MTNVFNGDPWATDEPVNTNGFSTVEAPEEAPSVSNVNVSTEDPIVLTFKQSGGYDAPWVVLRADTVAEAKALALSAHTEGLFETVSKAAAAFAATKGDAPVVHQRASAISAQAGPQAPQYAGPVLQQQAPLGDGRTCVHGPMVYKEGVSGKGPWKAYFCPTPKGTPDQCRAVFVR